MPIVQSIDGVFSLYKDRRNPQRPQQPAHRRTAPSLPDRSSDNPAYTQVRRAYEKGASLKPRRMAVVAQDIMTSPVVTVPEDATFDEAIRLAVTHEVRRLVVVNDTTPDRPTGMITPLDVIDWFTIHQSEREAATPPGSSQH